jgi:DNA mismatch endonuclease (patch repair protein)
MIVPTDAARSALMKRMRQRGTTPELVVRRLLHAAGARFRLNVRGLPGTPDVVNRRRRKAVFVHGCFWHSHYQCRRATIPQRNRAFWEEKLRRNRERDAEKEKALRALGYDVLTVWECELGEQGRLRAKLIDFWGI